LQELKNAILLFLFLFRISSALCFPGLCIEVPHAVAGEFMVLRVESNRSAEVRVNAFTYAVPEGESRILLPVSREVKIECSGQRGVEKIEVYRGKEPSCERLREMSNAELEKVRKGYGSREIAGLVLKAYYQKCPQRDFKLPAILILATSVLHTIWRRRK